MCPTARNDVTSAVFMRSLEANTAVSGIVAMARACKNIYFSCEPNGSNRVQAERSGAVSVLGSVGFVSWCRFVRVGAKSKFDNYHSDSTLAGGCTKVRTEANPCNILKGILSPLRLPVPPSRLGCLTD
jgi:hypothetical protein